MQSQPDWWSDPPAQVSGLTNESDKGNTTRDPARDPVEFEDNSLLDGQEGPRAGSSYFEEDDLTMGDEFSLQSTPVTMLYFALVAAMAGTAIGLVINFMLDGMATGTTAAVAIVGWLLSGIVAVLGVAAYQHQDLRLATAAMSYRPHSTASALRLLPLTIGAVGVVLTSYYIADWLARR